MTRDRSQIVDNTLFDDDPL